MEKISLSVDKNGKSELEKIALKFGFKWGNKGNISALATAIADQKLLVVKPEDLKQGQITTEQVEAIKKAITILSEGGYFESVEILAKMMKDIS